MLTRKRLTAVLLALATMLLAGLVLPSGIASALPGDCKGDAPKPQSPYAHFAVKPVTTSDGDPFTDPNVSMESVWGTEYRWATYDNGCNPASSIMPSVGTNVANLIGLELPGLLPNWSHYVMDQVIDPSGWIGPLEKPMVEATKSAEEGVWAPWAGVVLVILGCLVMWAARGGQLARSITALLWAGSVLLLTTWFMQYPTEASGLVDSGVRTAVTSVASGFADDGTGGQGRPAALAAMDKNYDAIVRNTQYRSWLEGAFGSAESPTAKKYGPDAFKSTHFSWKEYDEYLADPEGKGKKLIEAKAETFKKTADAVAGADPVAYQHFTGNEWSSRITTGVLNGVMVTGITLFLFAAAIAVFMAYVIVRLVVPLSPAAGVIFMLDTFREMAMGLLRRVAQPLVMGPVYLLAGLLMSLYDAAVLNAQGLNFVVKMIFLLATTYLVWKLLRPQWIAGIGSGHGRGMMSAVRTYMASRTGAEAGVEAAQKPAPSHPQEEQTASGSGAPVALPVSTQRPGLVAGDRPASLPASASTPGVFVERGAIPMPASTEGVSPRPTRGMRALPPVGDVPGASGPAVAPAALPAGESSLDESPAEMPPEVGVVATGAGQHELRPLAAAPDEDLAEAPEPGVVAASGATERGPDLPATDPGVVVGGGALDRGSDLPATGEGAPSGERSDQGATFAPRPQVGVAPPPAGSQEPQAPVQGWVVSSDHLPDVAEANEVLDNSGRPVFVVYSPAGSTTYYRGDE